MGQRLALLVGIDEAPPIPMQFGDPAKGDFRGYEVDVLESIAGKLGVGLRYRRALWSEIIAELAEGKLDLVCSAATVTAERARKVDFCMPHLTLTLALVGRPDEARGVGETDISNARVAVRQGTTAQAYVESMHCVPALVSESNKDIYRALAEGEVDIVVDDAPIALYFSGNDPRLRYVGPIPGTHGSYAVMVRKGNEILRGAFNAALAELEEAGELDDLRDRWFHSTQTNE
jgi:polar amino acid transport system substrate-binding protein